AAQVKRTSAKKASATGSHDIAIIGVAGRFPGADSVEEFWQMLSEGRAGTGEPPIGRWSEYNADEVLRTKMDTQNLQGGYLDDISSVDPELFGLSPLRPPTWIRNSASPWNWSGKHSKTPACPPMNSAAPLPVCTWARPIMITACSSPLTRPKHTLM